MATLGSVIWSTVNRAPKSTRLGTIYSSVCDTLQAAYTWMDSGTNTRHAAFNTRVPAERYEATMNNRTSVRVADGSENPDYYVTLTVYHELHCLVSLWALSVLNPFSTLLIRGPADEVPVVPRPWILRKQDVGRTSRRQGRFGPLQ
jgi:hypothetical protein